MTAPALPDKSPEFLRPLLPCNVSVSRCPVSREEASHRILILRLGAYGDILMGTPLLAALRASYPTSYLIWMAGPAESQAIDANPYLDELIRWDGDYFRYPWRHGNPVTALRRSFAFWGEMRRRRCDIFVSFQPEEWPLLTLAVGAAQRIGIFNTFARHWGEERNPHYIRRYTQAYSYPERHRTDQYLLALEAMGLPLPFLPRLSLGFTASDLEAAASFLEHSGITAQDDVVVLAPMTTWPTKCWPAERFAALGAALVHQHDCRIVLIGSRSEGAALAALAAQFAVPPAVAAGTLTFRQIAALISRAALVVSGDTGPMHVAAALGVPQVALFGPTSPQWYGPLSENAVSLWHSVPCGPCDQKLCPNTGADYEKCMDLLSVAEVTESASRLLAPSTVNI